MVRSSTNDDNETQRLLQHDPEVQQSASSDGNRLSSFPLSQLAVLCFLRMLDPLNFTQILPYINAFVAFYHITDDPSQIGFYSGVIESIFALCQLVAIYPWSSLSDRIGRRPVILTGLLGLTISTLTFGFSRSLLAATASRGLAGLFSGNVAVIPSMLSEITNRESESVVFPFFGIFWPIGSILGPLIGGSLPDIASKYPMFFNYAILKAYPYFLPSLIIASINSTGMISAYLFLAEAHKPIQTTANLPTVKPPSARELLANTMIQCLCASACFLSFVTTAFDVIFVLFCYTPIKKGGLGLETNEIGWALSISGIAAALFQIILMPALLRRVDHAKCYHFSVAVWPAVFLILPMLNVLARYATDVGVPGHSASAGVWIGIAIVLIAARIGFLPYTINALFVKRYISPSSLGASNGLLQFFISLSRSFSPFVSSSIFVITTEKHLLMGYGWAVLLFTVSLGGIHFSGRIVRESQKYERN